MLRNVHRVLSANGVFISISFSQPHFRRLVFEDQSFSWSMKWATFGDTFHYFFYTLKKGSYIKPSMDHRVLKYEMDLVQEHMNEEDYLLQALLDDP
ncbi:hypothetical protein KP509_11G099200 [Ceratopteris richardii]|uniref:Uncharacterized protein n=1 Tax=Ceratopteris richardii TaxID=49495 RepID=A0A8T2TS28_CERRI|nr:hypothetical protein KP509_11G099200 [Ceratopteris richardii]